MSLKIVVNHVKRIVNDLWHLVIFIDHPLDCINRIFELR